MKYNPAPYTSEAYTEWIRERVQNSYILFLNQLVFGCLQSYFIFKVLIFLLGKSDVYLP